MRLGDYEVLEELGRGGAGIVFRARAPDGGSVALKLLTRTDRAGQVRFAQEQRLAADLGQAQGFVPVLDAGESPRGAFLVMPLLEGGTLRDRLRRGPLPLVAAVALVRELAAAVGRAHARGIVHRDIKPENVLFTGEGQPLVADLGLAKHHADGASLGLSRTGEMRGSAGYMAPEQMHDAKRVGPPADVFGLGAILFECLSGQPAYPGQTIEDVLRRVATDSRASLSEVRPDVPSWLARVVTRALAPDPAARYRDGAELAAALQAPTPRRSPRLLALVACLAAGGGLLRLLVQGPAPEAAGEGRPAPVATASAPLPSDQPPPPPPVVVSQGARVKAGELVVQVERLLAAKDVEGSLMAADRAVALAPDLASAWSWRARVQDERGRLEEASSDLSRALELAPLDADTWSQRAVLNDRLDRRAEALRDFSRVIELRPEDADAWARRGRVRVGLGDLDGALVDASQAIGLSPSNFSYSIRADIHLRRGDLREAILDAERVLERDPGQREMLTVRGRARLGLSDAEGARADFERALELDPTRPHAWSDRARARAALGDTAGAIADLERVLELRPSDELAAEARGRLGELQAR